MPANQYGGVRLRCFLAVQLSSCCIWTSKISIFTALACGSVARRKRQSSREAPGVLLGLAAASLTLRKE